MKKITKFTIISIVAIVFSFLAINRMPQFIVITTLGGLGVFLINRFADKDSKKILLSLFLFCFLLQLFISLGLYETTVDTKYYGFSYKGDDYVYGDFGTIVGKLWRSGTFSNLKDLEYYNLIGEASDLQRYQLYNVVVFYLFGNSAGQILLIVNCFLHAIILLPVYLICKNLSIAKRITTFCITLFLFWPSTFYWSLFNFKEPLILLTIFIIFSILLSLKNRFSIVKIISLFFSAFFLYLLRRYLFILLPLSVLYLFCIWKWKYKVLLMILGGIAAVKQFFGRPILNEISSMFKKMPQTLFGIRYSSRNSTTGYFNRLLTFTHTRTMLYFPLGVLTALFLPFLLRPTTISQVIANIESITWWFLLPFLFNGLWIALRKELIKTFPMIIFLLFWISLLSLTQGNMGTLLRQKAIVYYTSFIFIALALDRITKEIKPETTE